MADNISVSITADATKLRSEMAIAQAALKGYQAELRTTAQASVAAGGATAEQSVILDKNSAMINALTGRISQLKSGLGDLAGGTRNASQGLEQVNTSAEHAGHGTAGITREVIVLGHEMLQGNFSKIPGSMMVLTERTGGLLTAISSMSGAMWAGVAAVTAIGAAFFVMAEHAHQAEVAMRAVANAALLQGRTAAVAEANAKGWIASMQTAGNLGTTAATALSRTIGTIPGLSDAARAKLAELAPALNQVLHDGDASETVKSIDQIFRTTSSMKSFVDENRLLTAEQQNSFDAAIKAKDAYLAQGIALDALKARIAGPYAEFVSQSKTAAGIAAGQAGGAMGITPNFTTPGALAGLPPLRLPQTGTTAESEETRRGNEVQQEYISTLRERQKLVSDMTILQGNLAKATTEESRTEAAAAIKDNQTRQDSLKDRGASDHMQQWNADLEARLAAVAANSTGVKAIELNEAKERVAFWTQASAQMGVTDAEHTAAMAQQSRARAALMMLEARQGAAGAKETESALNKMDSAQLAHLEKQAQIDAQGFQEKKAGLDAEVADHMMTKQTEIEQLRQLTDQQYQLQHQALQDFAATQNLEVAVRQQALDRMSQLEATHNRNLSALNREMVQADRADQQRELQSYTQMFSGIESEGKSAITGLIKGQTTLVQAAQSMAGAVLDSAVSLTGRLVARWAATEVAKTMATHSGVAARVAVEQAEGGSGWGALVAKWLGLETAKTTATVAGVTTRAGTEAAADVAGLAAAKVSDLSQIMGDAGVAAAGAYASQASIPYIGPALAAAAAAEAFATVMSFAGFASFDQGANYVPRDMIAQVHAGEAIIPAYDAAKMRSGGDTHYHYSPRITGTGGGAGGPLNATAADAFKYFRGVTRNGAVGLPGRALA